jgi:hypothetical protein
VLPAAAPRNFLRVTLVIALPFLWIGFVDKEGRYFCFCQDSIRQIDTQMERLSGLPQNQGRWLARYEISAIFILCVL